MILNFLRFFTMTPMLFPSWICHRAKYVVSTIGVFSFRTVKKGEKRNFFSICISFHYLLLNFPTSKLALCAAGRNFKKTKGEAHRNIQQYFLDRKSSSLQGLLNGEFLKIILTWQKFFRLKSCRCLTNLKFWIEFVFNGTNPIKFFEQKPPVEDVIEV